MEMMHLPFLKSYKARRVHIQWLMAVSAVTMNTFPTDKNHIYLVLVYSKHSPHEDISALGDVKLQ